MRSVAVLFSCFLLLAAVWSIHPPLSAVLDVHALSTGQAGTDVLRDLKRGGNSSVLALRMGLESTEPRVRLHCATVLALRGERDGDRCLLELLRSATRHVESQTIAAAAEQSLLHVWEERDGPPLLQRNRVLRASGLTPEQRLAELNETLDRFPAWSVGYIARARLLLQNGQGADARKDALLSLLILPENFEGALVLARALLLLDSPEQAWQCLDQAVRINPRLLDGLKDEFEEVRKALDTERSRHRREKRRTQPTA